MPALDAYEHLRLHGHSAARPRAGGHRRTVSVPELPVRHLSLAGPKEQLRASLLEREWLVANGLGGYASGTFAGVPTRRFHVAGRRTAGAIGRTHDAEPALRGARPAERASGRASRPRTPSEERSPRTPSAISPARASRRATVWTYAVGGHVLEKRVVVVHRQNTVHVTYALLEGERPAKLVVRPFYASGVTRTP